MSVAKEVTKEEHIKKHYKSPLLQALSSIDEDIQSSKKTSAQSKDNTPAPLQLDCSRASVGSLNGIVENAWVSLCVVCVCCLCV